MDSEVREAEPAGEDSAYVRSYLQASDGTLFGGQTLADELARRRSDERAKVDVDLPGVEASGDELKEDDLESGPRPAGRDARAQDVQGDRADSRRCGAAV